MSEKGKKKSSSGDKKSEKKSDKGTPKKERKDSKSSKLLSNILTITH
jgi:hypothetical protein